MTARRRHMDYEGEVRAKRAAAVAAAVAASIAVAAVMGSGLVHAASTEKGQEVASHASAFAADALASIGMTPPEAAPPEPEPESVIYTHVVEEYRPDGAK